MKKTKLELTLLLPNIPDAADQCVERLTEMLRTKYGIEDAHLSVQPAHAPSLLCIHYDPNQVAVADVLELAKRSGAELGQRYGHFVDRVEPMHADRSSAIQSRLSRVPGVLEVVVSPDGAVRVEFDRTVTKEDNIARALADWSGKQIPHEPATSFGGHAIGQTTDKHSHAGHDHSHGGLFGSGSELVFALLCGLFLLLGWLFQTFTEQSPVISLGLFLGAYVLGGYYTVAEAFEKLRSGKFEIDFLMIVAATGAATLGAWAEGSLLLFLFSLGHALEGYAMGRARRAIEALSELAPRVARVRRDGTELQISVEELVIGDVVVIQPDEGIAADGFVIAGESSVNQAPITGESVPVDKQPVMDQVIAASNPNDLPPESRVFAGTINQAGSLEIKVTKLASDSTLSRVITMVNEAETRVSPTQRFTKRFEQYFVPIVVGGVLLLLCAPLIRDEPFRISFYRAMAVLVAASPCALAIATPSAVLSGVARAARDGILVKGGGPLESLAGINAIAFDKTGTLTQGAPQVTDIYTADDIAESDLLRTVLAVENLSRHPLAKAVVRYAKDQLNDGVVPEAIELKSITGRGIRAIVAGDVVYIGKDALFAEIDGRPVPDKIRDVVAAFEGNGRTTMIVRRADHYLGVIGLMDSPRKSAKPTIARLRQLGMQRMIMISGDNQAVADAVAQEIGLDEALGDLMPADKVAEIKKINQHGGVAMVGDGVNDAPAMAAASVGIAMGAAGSDVALETADVALMADNLEQLPTAIGVSRATRRIIRQNLWMSLGMVAILVPATILGLNIGPAVALHEGSTLIVVVNALRLLAYQTPPSVDGPEHY